MLDSKGSVFPLCICVGPPIKSLGFGDFQGGETCVSPAAELPLQMGHHASLSGPSTGSSPWQPVLELTTPASWPNTWLVLDLFLPLLSYIASPPPLLLPGSAPLLLSSPPWRPANSFPAASDALPAYPSHCPQSDTLRKQHRPQHRPLPPKTSGASPYNNPGSSVCVCVCSKPSKVSWLLSTSLILPPTPSLENPTIQSEDFHSSTVCAV